MPHHLRSRAASMDVIRRYVAIHPWFAFYALEQLCVESDIRILNELAEGLVALVEQPEMLGNAKVAALVRERFH